MKKSITCALLIFIASCGQTNDQGNDQLADSLSVPKQGERVNVPSGSEMERVKPDSSGFYLINISATAIENDAVEQVKELKSKGHPAGYLWIPDFQSLSRKELFSVFIGPFPNLDSAVLYLEDYKKYDPKAYLVKAENSNKRTTVLGNFDIRINDVRQFLIFTYARPEQEEAYYEEGGEDWGWFVGDVQEYFHKNFPGKVFLASTFNSWLTEKDIKALEKELRLEGFGYILINGKKKSFYPHEPSEGVIRNACEFFGLEYKPAYD
jgi:hypothetical protein